MELLGPSAIDAPPGTDTINRLIARVDGPVLLLFDELLNLFSRHRGLGEPMHAFLHNIVRGFVGSNHRAAVISLPQPGRDDRVGLELAGQDREGHRRGRQAATGQRRGGNQRSDPSAAIREPRAGEDAEDCGTRLRRLVLRAARTTTARMDFRRYLDY